MLPLGSRTALVPLCLASLAACSFAGGSTTVQGSGTSAEEVRAVDAFTEVSFALPGTLRIEQSDVHSLRLEGDENLLEHVVTEVRDGTLRIRTERTRLEPRLPLQVYVTTRTLEGIEAAGSGHVEAADLRVEDLAVSVAGSGETRLPNLHADELTVRVAGSGTVEVSGVVRSQTLSLAGSGGVEARELESETVEASIAGSGSAFVRVRDRISANLVGSGSVQYLGDPTVSSNTVGSGRVVRLDP